MKNKAMKLLLGLTSLSILASCGGNAPSTPSSSSGEPAPSSSSEPGEPLITDTYTDIDTLDLDSGEYMVSQTIYTFDKANKKINATKYEDYDSYKSKGGTVLYDGAARFVKVTSLVLGNIDAAYFEMNDTVYLLHLGTTGKVSLSTRTTVGWTTSGAALVGEIPLFSMGNYVSDKQTQNKVNEEGSYIYDSQDNAVKEEFYLFLELTKTKASLYLGDNPNTHAESPMHSVENYKTLFVSGKLMIKIPHTGGEFACTLTARSETEISFTNSMERKGDYSCSGTFTKIDA